MTTFCNTDSTTPAEIKDQLDAIENALGEYATTDDNPCGGAAYYDQGEALPWRLLYCDGSEQDRFATSAEAVEAAESYVAEMA